MTSGIQWCHLFFCWLNRTPIKLVLVYDGKIDQLQVETIFVLFFKTIVFNALIPNILLSRLSDEQK